MVYYILLIKVRRAQCHLALLFTYIPIEKYPDYQLLSEIAPFQYIKKNSS